MINHTELRTHIIAPVLERLGMYSKAAEDLLVGTACVESMCGYWLTQVNGPALGIYQMEPATHDSVWWNNLRYDTDRAEMVKRFGLPDALSGQLSGNLFYATAMCRVHYWYRSADPIPQHLIGQAEYWKEHWNTSSGAGTVEDYLAKYYEFGMG